MKKVIFITQPDAEYGFSLAGVIQHITDRESLEDTVREAITKAESGLLVIDERLMQGFPEERLKEIEQGWHGILLILPAPERPGIAIEDYMARLIRRAIGYHVRLQL